MAFCAIASTGHTRPTGGIGSRNEANSPERPEGSGDGMGGRGGMSRPQPVDEDGNPIVPVDEDGTPCADGDRECVRAFFQANRPERPEGSGDGMGGRGDMSRPRGRGSN